MVLALSAVMFHGCVEPEPEPEPLSNDAKLSSVSFSIVNNPMLEHTANAVNAVGYMFASVSEKADLSKLAPTIKCSKGATVKIDGKEYVEGQTYDFSKVAKIEVTSESGTKSTSAKISVTHGDTSIDETVYSFMNDFNVPGVSISIMKGSKVVYSKGYGFSVKSKEEVCTPDHLFRMASISKQFCTMCIMSLKEEGKLGLDDQVFGDKGILHGLYQNITSYHEGITVRHLLSHSSGLCKGLSDPCFTTSYRKFKDNTPVPTDTLIQRTLNNRQYPDVASGITWCGGAAYNYSNIGFCVLHRIVEVVSGKDYETYLKEVLARMGVTDTHIGGYENERRANECYFYSQDGANGYDNPLRMIAGAAGIITSTNQMMKVLAHMDGEDDVPDVFTSETLKEMYTPYTYAAQSYNRYGLGWRMNHSTMFKGAHYHGGNIAGTATLWVGHTNSGMSGAMVCNSRAYNSNSNGDIDDNLYIILSKFMNYFN